MCKYYGMWLRFFQRQPGKELWLMSAMFTALLARTRPALTWKARLHQLGGSLRLENALEKADWEERYNTIRRGRNTTVMIGRQREPRRAYLEGQMGRWRG
jgi:hypothetical protein